MILLAVLYVLVALLVGGFVFQGLADRFDPAAEVGGVAAGVFWPLVLLYTLGACVAALGGKLYDERPWKQ